jgi:hypothetical protein
MHVRMNVLRICTVCSATKKAIFRLCIRISVFDLLGLMVKGFDKYEYINNYFVFLPQVMKGNKKMISELAKLCGQSQVKLEEVL